MLVLALIPARGGSKSVPRKNVRQLAGKPVIAWTIEAALASERVGRTVVSTDDEEIAETARRYGAETPFLRPEELARDDTPDLPVYLHALSRLEQEDGYRPQVVAWLRPTAPLRTAADIDSAVDLLAESGAPRVRSVCPADHHPYWMRRLEGGRLVPVIEGTDEGSYFQRQLLPEVYRLNGAVDAVRCDAVAREGRLFEGEAAGFVMSAERSIDLDSELDFAIAAALLERQTAT